MPLAVMFMESAKLLTAAGLHNLVDNRPYIDFGLRTEWHTFTTGTQEQTLDNIAKIIAFLGQWGSLKWPIDYHRLVQQIRAIDPLVRLLEPHRFEDVDFDRQIIGYIDEIFNRLDSVRGIGPTNASKILRLWLPHLIIMWDGDIEREYRRKHGQGSGSFFGTFQFVMQQELKEAISDFCQQKQCERTETIRHFRSFSDDSSIPKLLDEYNWLRYRRKHPELQDP